MFKATSLLFLTAFLDSMTGLHLTRSFHNFVMGDLKKGMTPMSTIVRNARGGRDLPDSWLKPMDPKDKRYRKLPRIRCPKSMCPHLYK